MIHFVVDRAGAFGIQDFVELHAPELAPRVRVVCYEDLPNTSAIASGTYIFGALDRVTPGGMQLVRELVTQLRQPGTECRVLNDPDRVLLRFDLLASLHRAGLNRHNVARATDRTPTVRYPVFVREEHRHNGAITPLLRNPRELRRALGRATLRGYRLSDLIIVEYCETGSVDGRYHRYSAFIAGDRIVARELMVGDEWMLKSHGNAPTLAEVASEDAYVIGNEHEAELAPIFALAGIEYGRIDYAVVDGKIETWEINTNPTIRRGRQTDPLPIPAEINRLRDPMRVHFTRSFVEALIALDSSFGQPRQLPIQYSADVLRAAKPVVRDDGMTWLRHVARAVTPLVPTLNQAIDLISPVVSRVAGRRARS
jgi:hypothetical protein